VLIVDEAQGLPLRTLEEIRMLLNLETTHEKLLQVILAGQPELEEKLKSPELRQLRQRITVRCRTAPLTLPETQAYIQDRLRTAGTNEPIFQPEAVAFVYVYSRGIPRVMNLLCEHSLISACANSSRVVYPRFVERAAHECQVEQVDSLSRVLNSSYPSREALGDISSIFAGISLPDSTPPSDTSSVDSSILTEAPPAAINSEVNVQMRGSGSGEAVIALEEQLRQASDLGAPPYAVVLPESSTVFPPTLRDADIAQERRASSAGVVQAWPSASSSHVHSAQQRGGLSRATASLCQAWWRSFSVDAHSTWRQLRKLLRAQVLKCRPYARGLS
jgi:hypothetical protein